MMNLKLFLVALACFIFAVASAVTAQQEERVFSEYLNYLTEQEGYNLTDAIKEIQSLKLGKESLIQSYIKTEQDLENLRQSASKQSDVTLDEKQYPQSERPNWEGLDSLSTTSFKNNSDASDNDNQEPFLHTGQAWRPLSDIDANSGSETEPPRFQLVGIKEDTNEAGAPCVDVTLANNGGEGDVSVSIVTKDGVLISQPFSQELKDVSGTKVLSFQLLQQPEQIAIQLQTDSGTLAIPVFLRKANGEKPVVINATPFEAQCQIGESVEYYLTLEGDPLNPIRYNFRVKDLPEGINSEILQAKTNYPIQSVKFSPAYKKHELILRLTLTNELDPKLIGTAIPFLLALGTVSERLTITPIGSGKIAIQSPLEDINIRILNQKTVTIRVVNIGSATIPKLEIFADDTTMGIHSLAEPRFFALPKGEAQEVTLTLSATKTANIGRHEIKITAYAPGKQNALSCDATLAVVVKEKAFFLTILKPGFALGAILVTIGIALLLNKKRVSQEELSEEVEYV